MLQAERTTLRFKSGQIALFRSVYIMSYSKWYDLGFYVAVCIKEHVQYQQKVRWRTSTHHQDAGN